MPSRTLANAPDDGSLAAYRAKRDFTITAEPPPAPCKPGKQPIFVVQKHDASRPHYDVRLEHDGVLWSWAVPKGPSMDPADKRLAVHVEDHPVEYATFAGTIPKGQYGAGTVEIWDSGTWSPLGQDPAADLARGEMKFTLTGQRLHGNFVFIRLKPRAGEKAENWLLIKERDDPEPADAPAKTRGPARGAKRGPMPDQQAPQLATLVEEPPPESAWINEIKFDGYRLMIFKDEATVRLVTRNGLDWTHRMPGVAALAAELNVGAALLDGELVAVRPDGVTSFPDLQAALASGRDSALILYLFDLLHLDGWDLRPAALSDRKAALQALPIWSDRVRFSDHVDGDASLVRRQACTMGLEGIIAKRAAAPYRAGRTYDWLKLKCRGREVFVVLGWTPPGGTRAGLGSLHLGFYDGEGALHYVGAVGTGFNDAELMRLRARLDPLAVRSPPALLLSGERPDGKINWVRPELVLEVQFIGWSGAGRIRHAVYLGLREDKTAAEVVRDIPDPDALRVPLRATRSGTVVTARAPAPRAVAPKRSPAPMPDPSTIKLTHPDKALWPGVTKQALADYWATVASVAMPGLAERPLALVRCVDGIDGPHFFQKHAMKGMSDTWREGNQDGAPYLAFDQPDGLRAAAQMAAIELHTWGSPAADAAHADRLVFDLDPGDGVEWVTTVAASIELRDRLAAIGLAAFCRTSGGKGLHVVAPVLPGPDWDTVRAWCRAFAEAMEADAPDRFVASVPKARRTGRILVDWLRNGLGSTAVASFSPRARPGATVATPVTWREVTPKLDPAAFTIATIPARLARQKADPWDGFAAAAKPIPILPGAPPKKRKR